jgi:hypothetical protein
MAMPLIFRTMFADGDKPQVGPTASTLGVRVAPAAKTDVAVDADGNVLPRTGGMSVAPAWRVLPDHRIPRRLKAKCPRATGNNKLFCWRMGEGPFVACAVNDDLVLTPDSAAHGSVEPVRKMAVADYEKSLAATQGFWVIDEV